MAQPRQLSGPAFEPASGGPTRQLVVLLHGVGADGDDLIGLAPVLAQILPDAAFVAPNAPERYDMAPVGYQWFSLQDRSPPGIEAGVRAAAGPLESYIDEQLEERGIDDGRLALLGFSQGCMMALHVGLRRPFAPAAILGYSGMLAAADALAAEIRCRPPVLLVHGEADPVVPFAVLAAAEARLRAAGVAVQSLARPGLGHGIDEEGLRHGAALLRQTLVG